jgi:hypothetical protein
MKLREAGLLALPSGVNRKVIGNGVCAAAPAIRR